MGFCAACQSKEQLKQLRVQKAAAAQQAALAESQRIKAAAAGAAALAAQARPRAAAGMPPPAPRAPSGSMPPTSSIRAAVNSSSGRPQVAVIRPKAQQAAQRSVNNRAQEPATPSGRLLDLELLCMIQVSLLCAT